ncbi:ABC transporter-like protein [Plautia stali symbiont]|nr:ABC transporter-like protein [Plautia stali symbiont]
MAKWQTQLSEAEAQLADSAIYEQSRKADLTAALQRQAESKSALEEVEMAWLEAQEQLEQMLAG